MEILNNYLIWLSLFLISLLGIFYFKKREKETVKAQFVVTTGCLLVLFYVVCFLSGVCTIINFIVKYFF